LTNAILVHESGRYQSRPTGTLTFPARALLLRLQVVSAHYDGFL
jgi:hypothetical protein